MASHIRTITAHLRERVTYEAKNEFDLYAKLSSLQRFIFLNRLPVCPCVFFPIQAKQRQYNLQND